MVSLFIYCYSADSLIGVPLNLVDLPLLGSTAKPINETTDECKISVYIFNDIGEFNNIFIYAGKGRQYDYLRNVSYKYIQFNEQENVKFNFQKESYSRPIYKSRNI